MMRSLPRPLRFTTTTLHIDPSSGRQTLGRDLNLVKSPPARPPGRAGFLLPITPGDFHRVRSSWQSFAYKKDKLILDNKSLPCASMFSHLYKSQEIHRRLYLRGRNEESQASGIE